LETFLRSKLDWSEAQRHAPVLRLYRDLLRLRRTDPVLAADGAVESGAVGEQALYLLRRQGREVRLLLANLGEALSLPLSALPPRLPALRPLLSTADAAYHLSPPEEQAVAPAARAAGGVIVLPRHTAMLLAGEQPV
ncbi:MAG TPA: DUF3459 domain-containing protein, partial [Dehalococcoidia bacterium]